MGTGHCLGQIGRSPAAARLNEKKTQWLTWHKAQGRALPHGYISPPSPRERQFPPLSSNVSTWKSSSTKTVTNSWNHPIFLFHALWGAHCNFSSNRYQPNPEVNISWDNLKFLSDYIAGNVFKCCWFDCFASSTLFNSKFLLGSI